MGTPDSDWDTEENSKTHKSKKSKHKMHQKDKKRKRSKSLDNIDSEKSRRKKSKHSKYSNDESDNSDTEHKAKESKYKRTDDSYSKSSRYGNRDDGDGTNSDKERRKSKKNKYKNDKPYKTRSPNESAVEERYKENSSKSKKKRAEELEDESKYSEKSYKKSSSRKHSDGKNRNDDYDDSYEHHDRGSSLRSPDEDDQSTTNSEKPYRFWSPRGPIRKNSDSYWNKYSDRLKESTNRMEVGPRYYNSGDNLKYDKTNNDNAGEKPEVRDEDNKKEKENEKSETQTNEAPQRQRKTIDLLTSRTGGAYIPPAKLRMMQESITDKSSAAYQRLAWEALKKSIQGHVNKVNTANIKVILKEVQKENIVRGRGLLCRALIQAQAASPSFTNVYAAFICVLNAKFPKIGELLLKRLVVQFRRGFKRNDKTICITAATFIAHLVNQEVAHEIIALEILTLLIETPTDDSVEVAIAFLKECGMKLSEVSNKGVLAIFDMLRNILHEGNLEKRVQYMIEVMFQILKEGFKAYPSLAGPELDLIHEEDKIQHMITLEDNHDPEDILNVFKFDPNYEENEAKYKSLVDLSSDDESDGEEGSGSDDSDDESEEDGEEEKSGGVIVDKTETNLVALRKTIYLTIQSSLDFEECAHKLLRMELKPGQEIEMAHMFLDCCAEQRTYEKFYGLLSQRFCQINRNYIGPFEETFRDSYATIHRMSNDKLRNVAKLFAHLLYTDAISWEVLATIRLNEDDTTSSSRIFIKILFLELSEYMGLAKLNQRVKDPSLQTALEGVFPRDNPKHTRFAINFFTSIGLGGLTDELREHLKCQPKETLGVPQLVEGLSSSSSSSSSSDSSSDSSDSSSSSSDSSSSDSEDTSRRRKKKEKQTSKNKKQTIKKLEKIKSLKKKKNSPPRKKKNR